MNPHSVVLAVVAIGLSLPSARAQFPSFPASDKVLGANNLNTPGAGSNTPSGLSFPSGVAFDRSSGKLFVVCNSQHRILRFANPSGLANGANAESVFGQVNFSSIDPGATATTLNTPYGIHIDVSGRLWVADSGNHRVLMFQGATSLGLGATADLVLGQPNFTTVVAGTTAAKMNTPWSVFVDAEDNLWVADSGNHRVLKFASVSTLANGASATNVLGQPNFVTTTSNTNAVKMSFPSGVTIDTAGRLWVADQNNHRVLRFDAAATLGNGAAANAVLGQPDFITNANGLSANAFNLPADLIVDAAGTLYVIDFFNSRVVFHKNAATKADGAAADGVIGQPDLFTNSPGVTERKLNSPYSGITFDAAGALWISDPSNGRVLRFSPDRIAAPPATSGKVPKSTSSSKLTLRGSASDTNGVAQVRYRVGKGAFLAASGTTSWTFKAKLKPGKNTIEIVTVDTVGNVSAAKRVKVTRE